jgi:hypothetical protein
MSEDWTKLSWEEDEQGRVCPTRLRSSDPDCTVIVGQQVFSHYSALLCNCSEFFDAMFSSDMKEGQSKTVTFAEKDPSEWQQVYRFIGSPATSDLKVADLPMLVSWFSELRMMEWLNRSDRLLQEHILQQRKSFDEMATNAVGGGGGFNISTATGVSIVSDVLEKVEMSILYGLSSSLHEGLSFLQLVLEDHLLFFNNLYLIDRLVAILGSSEVSRDYLWQPIKLRLRNSVQDMDPELLVENPLLGNVLLLEARIALSKQNVFVEGFCFGGGRGGPSFRGGRVVGFTFGSSP